MTTTKIETVGTVTLLKSVLKPGEKKVCICCPGHESHVFGMFLALQEAPDRDFAIATWLKEHFNYLNLEGRKIKITAELL